MSGRPSWYEPGNIAKSIRAALIDDQVDREQLATVLAENEFDGSNGSTVDELSTAAGATEDAIKDRAMDVITIAVDRREARRGPPEVYSTADFEPSQPSRYIDRSDATQMTDAELAHLFGLAFTRWGGNYEVITDAEPAGVDLVWNRQHETAVFRTISGSENDSGASPSPVVELEAVESDQLTVSRGIARRGVIALGTSIDSLEHAAQDTPVEIYGPTAVDSWLESVKLPRAVLAPIMQVGREQSSVTSDIQVELTNTSKSLEPTDPLDAECYQRTHEWDDTVSEDLIDESTEGPKTSTEDGTGPETPGQDNARELDETPEPGQKGTLYADPSMDGDYGSIDEYIDAADADPEDE